MLMSIVPLLFIGQRDEGVLEVEHQPVQGDDQLGANLGRTVVAAGSRDAHTDTIVDLRPNVACCTK